MPDRKTHIEIALCAGIAAVPFVVKEKPFRPFLVEALGVVAGTLAGGILPDVLEPATSSWHRRSFHSLTAMSETTVLTLAPPTGVRSWRDSLGTRAQALRQQREQLPAAHDDRPKLWLGEMAQHFLMGASAGLPLGYTVHLVADAPSPRGLPLI